jgi:hypothetical protein
MKKTFVAVIAIAAVLVASLAATAAYQSQQSQPGSGQLAILGIDPPTTASGVTATSAHYSSVSAHNAGSDMSSGWVQVSGSGTLDLMSTSAQTMATSKVNAATYDAFSFNVDSVQVTYQGQVYAATVASTTLTAQSVNQVVLNESSKAAAIVDLRTFVVNAGNSTRPQFIFSATAVATSVPASTVASLTLQVGGVVSLSGQAWWNGFVAASSTNVNLLATLSSNSLVLTLQNAGTAQAEVQEVVVTPVTATVAATTSLPSSLSGSAVFTASGASSLQSTTSLQAAALLNGGTTISSGSATSLSYSGSISMSYGTGSINVTGVMPGQQYLVTVIGANTYASALVVAS